MLTANQIAVVAPAAVASRQPSPQIRREREHRPRHRLSRSVTGEEVLRGIKRDGQFVAQQAFACDMLYVYRNGGCATRHDSD